MHEATSPSGPSRPFIAHTTREDEEKRAAPMPRSRPKFDALPAEFAALGRPYAWLAPRATS